MSDCIVFAGPSLHGVDIDVLLPEAQVAPPAQRGDVWRATELGAARIVLIDGMFERVPAVWHKEILYALSEGVQVYGASSMGALRAAEMSDFGMIGVGVVVDMVKAGELDDDDVAIVHGDRQHNFIPISVAMVDIIITMRQACRAAIINQESCDDLIALAKRTYYPDRNYRTLRREALVAGLVDEPTARRLETWLSENAVSQKREDAIELLARVRHDTDTGSMSATRPAFVRTVHFEDMVTEELARSESIDEVAQSVVDELRVDPKVWASAVDSATGRKARIEFARRSTSIDHEAFERVRAAFFEQEQIREGGLEEWLRTSGLTRRGLEHYLRNEVHQATASALLAGSFHHDLLAWLRSTGELDLYRNRAKVRSNLLRSVGRSESGSMPGDRTSDLELIANYEQATGFNLGSFDLDEIADDLGFLDRSDVRVFLRVVANTQPALKTSEID